MLIELAVLFIDHAVCLSLHENATTFQALGSQFSQVKTNLIFVQMDTIELLCVQIVDGEKTHEQ